MSEPSRTLHVDSSRGPLRAGTVALIAGAALVLFGCETCRSNSDCGGEALCLPTAVEGRNACMQACAAPTRLCSDGTVCLATAGVRVCYGGGNRSVGDLCAGDLECEPGSVCPASIGACVQACVVGDDRPCGDDESCEPITPPDGVCRRRPDPPDGGTMDADVDTGP